MFVYLLHQVANMWKTFLAFGPKLELMTNILAPSIRETPAQNTNNDVNEFATLYLAESA